MKKILHILFLSVFLTGAFAAIAQDTTKTDTKKKKAHAKSFIEITGGVSVPLGNFAKTDYTDLRSGFAAPGPVFSITGVKYIHHSNFGLGGTVSYAYYNMRNVKNISDGYQNDFDVDSTNVHTTQYRSIHVLVGPYYSIPLGIVTIDFHALAGVNIMTSPRIDVLLEDGGNSYTNGGTAYSFWQEASTSAVLATNLGVGVRVSPVKHFAISARIDYFYSRPVFNINNDYREANVGRLVTSYTQPFNGINASLGLVYEFGK